MCRTSLVFPKQTFNTQKTHHIFGVHGPNVDHTDSRDLIVVALIQHAECAWQAAGLAATYAHNAATQGQMLC